MPHRVDFLFATLFAAVVLLSPAPARANADLAVSVDERSGLLHNEIVVLVEIANLGTLPSNPTELDLTLRLGEWTFPLKYFEVQAFGGDIEDTGTRRVLLKPIAPGDSVRIDLLLFLPDEVRAFLDERMESAEGWNLRMPTRVSLRSATISPDADPSNDSAIALLGRGRFEMANGNGPHELPKLMPFPPPAASARLVLDRAALLAGLGDPAAPTLGAVADLLTDALKADGHRRFGFLGVPGDGFALLTGVEQIDADAVPLKGPARWSLDILVPPVSASEPAAWLSAVIEALFFAPKGHYRALLFVVSSEPVEENPEAEISTELLSTWAVKSLASLPEPVRALAFGATHEITAFVYEFEKATNDAPAAMIGGHSVQKHLEKTKLAGLTGPQ